jgi:hypothetical protein
MSRHSARCISKLQHWQRRPPRLPRTSWTGPVPLCTKDRSGRAQIVLLRAHNIRVRLRRVLIDGLLRLLSRFHMEPLYLGRVTFSGNRGGNSESHIWGALSDRRYRRSASGEWDRLSHTAHAPGRQGGKGGFPLALLRRRGRQMHVFLLALHSWSDSPFHSSGRR